MKILRISLFLLCFIQASILTATTRTMTITADYDSSAALPVTVSFSSPVPAQALGATWLWDFGDGSTSNQATPDHTYTKKGEYTVTVSFEHTHYNTTTYGAGDLQIAIGNVVIEDDFNDIAGSSILWDADLSEIAIPAGLGNTALALQPTDHIGNQQAADTGVTMDQNTGGGIDPSSLDDQFFKFQMDFSAALPTNNDTHILSAFKLLGISVSVDIRRSGGGLEFAITGPGGSTTAWTPMVGDTEAGEFFIEYRPNEQFLSVEWVPLVDDAATFPILFPHLPAGQPAGGAFIGVTADDAELRIFYGTTVLDNVGIYRYGFPASPTHSRVP